MRDTVTIEKNSYVVIRFADKNPGLWMMRKWCHPKSTPCRRSSAHPTFPSCLLAACSLAPCRRGSVIRLPHRLAPTRRLGPGLPRAAVGRRQQAAQHSTAQHARLPPNQLPPSPAAVMRCDCDARDTPQARDAKQDHPLHHTCVNCSIRPQFPFFLFSCFVFHGGSLSTPDIGRTGDACVSSLDMTALDAMFPSGCVRLSPCIVDGAYDR